VEIRQDDLSGRDTLQLLRAHLDNMKQITPLESVHALGVEELRSPDMTVWSAWEGDVLLGCGALRALDSESGEIKAMRTDDGHRRKGVGSRILEHIIEEARRRGYQRLYLETGAMPEFSAARALYGRYGFRLRGPFADYLDDPNSVFMVKELQQPHSKSIPNGGG
jgi:putative acetyltransferase